MRDCVYFSLNRGQWYVWSMTEKGRFSWGAAGSVFFAIDRERKAIVALFYWNEADIGQEGGPDGEPVVTEPSWTLLMADDPYWRHQIDAPHVADEMTDEELVTVYDEATYRAAFLTLEYLESKGLL